MPRIIETTSPIPSDVIGQLAYYSGMDNLTLFEIRDGIKTLLTPEKETLYQWELELQAPLLEMAFNGILVNGAKRAELIRAEEKTLSRLHNILHQLCEAIGYYEYYLDQTLIRFSDVTNIPIKNLPRSWSNWTLLPVKERRAMKKHNPQACAEFHAGLKLFGPPYLPGNRKEWTRKKNGAFNGNSPDHKLQLFYDFFGHYSNTISTKLSPDFQPPWLKTRAIVEYKSRDHKNEFTPTTNREALEKIQYRALDGDERDAHFWASPFVACCLDIADCSKTLGFLRCKLENGYFKSSFGAVTETGRLNSRKNPQGYGWNAQNVSPPLREIFVAEPRWKLAAPDYEQIESRIVGAICYRLFGATAYLNACECGDLHSLACSLVWPVLGWPSEFTLDYLEKYGPPFPKEIIKAAKQIANQEFYRGKSRRDVSKTAGHARNYRSTEKELAKRTHIELKLIHHYYKTSDEHFPETLMWHRWVAEQLQTKGEITTMLGRTRRFFNRPNDDTTLREAIAYEPQSIAADYCNQALLKIFKASQNGLPIKLFLQKHDEIGFRFLEMDEDIVVPTVCDIMEQSIPIKSPEGTIRPWSVSVEATTGWNLKHRIDYDKRGNKLEVPINPDGLMEYNGHDSRTRQTVPNHIDNFLNWEL